MRTRIHWMVAGLLAGVTGLAAVTGCGQHDKQVQAREGEEVDEKQADTQPEQVGVDTILIKIEGERTPLESRQLADDVPNEPGLSIAECEYWWDTMDRWAEDLVDPASGGS